MTFSKALAYRRRIAKRWHHDFQWRTDRATTSSGRTDMVGLVLRRQNSG